MRALGGLLRIAFVVFIYIKVHSNVYIENQYKSGVEDWFINTLGETSGELSAKLFMFLYVAIMFVILIKGAMKVIFSDKRPEMFEGYSLRADLWDAFTTYTTTSGASDSQTSNIESIIQYRESKLGTVSGDKAVEEYAKTAGLDAIMNGGRNTQDARNFLDSKLASRPGDKGYEYVKKTFGGS